MALGQNRRMTFPGRRKLMHSGILVMGLLLLWGPGSAVWAASSKALALRQTHGLLALPPPEKFLSANFVGDEVNPAFIFGPVQGLAGSRKCPTTWLIEAGEKKRLEQQSSSGTLGEYTLYLEEDCPDRVVYYVFVDQCCLSPQQWLEWRRQFHKSKTDQHYGAAQAKLEQALAAGFAAGAELRFILKDGELIPKSAEDILRDDLKYAPIYDLNRQQKLSP